MARSRGLLAWLACYGVRRATADSGATSCPCASTIPSANTFTYSAAKQQSLGNGVTDTFLVYPSGQDGNRYEYPVSYGLSTCQAWDGGKAPFCDGTARPHWCEAQWCYVNEGCALEKYKSAYFTGAYYSYTTCGAGGYKSTRQCINVDGTASTGCVAPLTSVTQLADRMTGYLMATRDEIERSSQADSTSENCAGAPVDSCVCANCAANALFGTNAEVDPNEVSMMLRGSPTQTSTYHSAGVNCTGQGIAGTFKRTAAVEKADITARVGKMRFGMQAYGEYAQWPAEKMCTYGSGSTSFDPRYTEWYGLATAGPRDVVIVLDISGSMKQSNRISMAKEAAKTVIDTLSWVDYVTVVSFSTDAQKASDFLLPATYDNKNRLKRWINGLSASGSTNFVEALANAFEVFTNSYKNRNANGTYCFSSRCAAALLFLTDGEPDRWSELDYTKRNEENAAINNYVKIFGYAFGSGANQEIPKKLAEDHGGKYFEVGDNSGSHLKRVMATYYNTWAEDPVNFVKNNNPRWIRTKNEEGNGVTHDAIMGCLPVYDRDPASPSLLGATCMDVGMIDNVSNLATNHAGEAWQAFLERIEIESRYCAMTGALGTVKSDNCSQSWDGQTVNGAWRLAGPSALRWTALLLAALAAAAPGA